MLLKFVASLRSVYLYLQERLPSLNVDSVFASSRSSTSTEDNANTFLVLRQRLEEGSLASPQASSTWWDTWEKTLDWFIRFWRYCKPELVPGPITQTRRGSFLQPPFHHAARRLISKVSSGIASRINWDLPGVCKYLECMGKNVVACNWLIGTNANRLEMIDEELFLLGAFSNERYFSEVIDLSSSPLHYEMGLSLFTLNPYSYLGASWIPHQQEPGLVMVKKEKKFAPDTRLASLVYLPKITVIMSYSSIGNSELEPFQLWLSANSKFDEFIGTIDFEPFPSMIQEKLNVLSLEYLWYSEELFLNEDNLNNFKIEEVTSPFGIFFEESPSLLDSALDLIFSSEGTSGTSDSSQCNTIQSLADIKPVGLNYSLDKYYRLENLKLQFSAKLESMEKTKNLLGQVHESTSIGQLVSKKLLEQVQLSSVLGPLKIETLLALVSGIFFVTVCQMNTIINGLTIRMANLKSDEDTSPLPEVTGESSSEHENDDEVLDLSSIMPDTTGTVELPRADTRVSYSNSSFGFTEANQVQNESSINETKDKPYHIYGWYFMNTETDWFYMLDLDDEPILENDVGPKKNFQENEKMTIYNEGVNTDRGLNRSVDADPSSMRFGEAVPTPKLKPEDNNHSDTTLIVTLQPSNTNTNHDLTACTPSDVNLPEIPPNGHSSLDPTSNNQTDNDAKNNRLKKIKKLKKKRHNTKRRTSPTAKK